MTSLKLYPSESYLWWKWLWISRIFKKNVNVPIMIGFFQVGTSLGMFFIMIGSLKTVPPIWFLIVPLGDFHIFLRANSLTLASSGVMVAHLMPTLHSTIAWAASRVTLSSVSSLFFIPRSKYLIGRSKKGRINLSLIIFQITRVISSPSSSAIGFVTLIF